MGAQPVIPLRVYEDMEAAQRFLVDVFGFKEGRLIRDGNGRPFHAEVHTGDSVIWIHRVDPEHGLVSARSLPAQPGGLVVFVDDVNVHYRHAKSSGPQSILHLQTSRAASGSIQLGTLKGTSGTSRRDVKKARRMA